MTFTYFIGLIIVSAMLNFCIVTMLDGILGLFYRQTGDKYVKVIVKNDGFNY